MSASTARRRRLLVNAAANWFGFAAQVAAALVLSPVLVHELGDGRYGIWSQVESVLAYLMLFDLGVGVSVVRYVARFEASRDRDALNRVFNTSLAIFVAAGLAVSTLVLLIGFGGMHWLRVPAGLVGEARGMLLLLGVNLAVGLPLGIFPAVLDGLERYPVKTAIRTVALLLRSLAFLHVARAGGGLTDLAWTITGCNVLEHLALAAAAWWYLPELQLSPRWLDRATFRTIRGYSLHAFLALVAGRVTYQTAALVIGAVLSPEAVTLFVVGARLVEYAKNALRALTAVLTPTVSALDAHGDERAIRRMFLDVSRYVLWLVLPIQAGLLLLGRPFLAVWLGPKYAAASYPTLVILAAPLALAMTQSVAARMLYGLGRLQVFVRVVLAEAVVNLVLSIALARPLGIEGVAWAATLPNVVANLAVMAYVCRLVGVGPREYLWRSFLGPCAVTALLAAGWLLAHTAWEPTCWAELLTVGLAGVAGYAATAALVELGPAALLEPAHASRRLFGGS